MWRVASFVTAGAAAFAAAIAPSSPSGTDERINPVHSMFPGSVTAGPSWIVDLDLNESAEVLGFAFEPLKRSDFGFDRQSLSSPMPAGRTADFGARDRVAVLADDPFSSADANGKLMGVSLETGKVVWSRLLPIGSNRCSMARPGLVTCLSNPFPSVYANSGEVFVVDGATGRTVIGYEFDDHVQDFVHTSEAVYALTSVSIYPEAGEPYTLWKVAPNGDVEWTAEVFAAEEMGRDLSLDYDPLRRTLSIVSEPYARVVDTDAGVVSDTLGPARLTTLLTSEPRPVVAYETFESDFDSTWTLATDDTVTEPSTEAPWRSTVPLGTDGHVGLIGMQRTGLDVEANRAQDVWLPGDVNEFDTLWSTDVRGLVVVDTFPGIKVVDTGARRSWRIEEPQRWAENVVGPRWVAWLGRKFWVEDLTGRLVYESEPLGDKAALGTMTLAPGGVVIARPPELVFVAVD